MALTDDIKKYKTKPSDIRLNIILEGNNKQSTQINIESLKLLIEEDDLNEICKFLGVKPELPPLKLESGEMNQDDFTIQVVRAFGKIKDKKSLGNRILTGQTNKFNIQSHYKPDVLLKKFAVLSGKEYQELDFRQRNNGSGIIAPLWDCCILGTFSINIFNETKVGR